MEKNEALFEYILRLADNNLVLGHRLSEWCGHGPILETDIAMTNIALDLVGQARNWYVLAAETEAQGRTEDDLAYLRDVYLFRNALLCEIPNGHFGDTMARQFFYDAFHYHCLVKLQHSSHPQVAAIAQKSLKEVTYHLRFSSEWIIRLGDGTEESHQKIQQSIEEVWMYTGDLFEMNEVDKLMIADGTGVDLSEVKALWDKEVEAVLEKATLQKPQQTWMNKGGKEGKHTEHLGYLLAELQFLPRAYPGAAW